MGCCITGCGKALPALKVTNDQLSEIVETSNDWIVERTGILERRIAAEESTTDLAVAASYEALEKAALAPCDLDLIVCMTITPDALIPAQACMIKERLGATKAVAFDVNAACAGCVYGLEVASAMIEAGASTAVGEGDVAASCRRNGYRRALVVGAERLSRIVDWTDRATCVLFGDGAGACVLQWNESEPGILSSYLNNSDDTESTLACGQFYDTDNFPFADLSQESKAQFITMDGPKVFKWASSVMVDAVCEVCRRAGISLDDVALIVPHQANERIIRFAAKKLGLPMDRFQVSIAEVGNTSASSGLMALADAYSEGRIAPGDKVVVVAFGGGLTCGAILFQA